MTSLFSPKALLLAVALTISGCTYSGGDIGDPLTRKFHWFSFVGGDDIRADCQPGTPDRYRLVYNGIYHEQLRIYELDSIRRVLVQHATGNPSLTAVDPQDLAGPWRATEARRPLDEAGYDRVVGSFADSGMFGPPTVGLSLPARSYYWTAAYCRDGRFGFTAWKYPSAPYDALTLDDTLFALDQTGVPVAQPGPVPLDPQWEDRAKRGEATDFTLKVGRDGLVR